MKYLGLTPAMSLFFGDLDIIPVTDTNTPYGIRRRQEFILQGRELLEKLNNITILKHNDGTMTDKEFSKSRVEHFKKLRDKEYDRELVSLYDKLPEEMSGAFPGFGDKIYDVNSDVYKLMKYLRDNRSMLEMTLENMENRSKTVTQKATLFGYSLSNLNNNVVYRSLREIANQNFRDMSFTDLELYYTNLSELKKILEHNEAIEAQKISVFNLDDRLNELVFSNPENMLTNTSGIVGPLDREDAMNFSKLVNVRNENHNETLMNKVKTLTDLIYRVDDNYLISKIESIIGYNVDIERIIELFQEFDDNDFLGLNIFTGKWALREFTENRYFVNPYALEIKVSKEFVDSIYKDISGIYSVFGGGAVTNG